MFSKHFGRGGTFVQVKVKVTLKVEPPLVPDLNPKLLDALKTE